MRALSSLKRASSSAAHWGYSEDFSEPFVTRTPASEINQALRPRDLTFYYIYLFIGGGGGGYAHLWRSEVNFQESVLSFYRLDPRDQTQGVRLGHSVYPLLLWYLLLCSVEARVILTRVVHLTEVLGDLHQLQDFFCVCGWWLVLVFGLFCFNGVSLRVPLAGPELAM